MVHFKGQQNGILLFDHASLTIHLLSGCICEEIYLVVLVVLLSLVLKIEKKHVD